MRFQPSVLAKTVLSDRVIVNRLNPVTGVAELVIECTPCTTLACPVEFTLPEGSGNDASIRWADDVDEHFREAHR